MSSEFLDNPDDSDFLAPRPRCHFGWRFLLAVVAGGLASWAVVCVVARALWHAARGLGL